MSKNTVLIIDYGSGNLRSAAKAFEKVGRDTGLNPDVRVSGNADDLDAASHIVLPGQGAFGDCINGLRAVDGMIEALGENILKRGKPFLGICVGMQLLADEGLEGGQHKGLGWIGGQVRAMRPSDPALKIPHMGWNTLQLTEAGKNHSVLRGVKGDAHFYYVHSYVFECTDSRHLLGTSEYGGVVPTVVGRDNIIGTQFHPEKSHDTGLQLISGFMAWRP